MHGVVQVAGLLMCPVIDAPFLKATIKSGHTFFWMLAICTAFKACKSDVDYDGLE
jgi:hypothetical protein